MYELTKLQEENCMNVAKFYLSKGDKKMAKFWENASRGYQIKAENLKLEESGILYDDYNPFTYPLEDVEYIQYIKRRNSIDGKESYQLLKVIIYPTGKTEVYKENKRKHTKKIKKQRLEDFYNDLICFLKSSIEITKIDDNCSGRLKIQFNDGNDIEYDRESVSNGVCLETMVNEFFGEWVGVGMIIVFDE